MRGSSITPLKIDSDSEGDTLTLTEHLCGKISPSAIKSFPAKQNVDCALSDNCKNRCKRQSEKSSPSKRITHLTHFQEDDIIIIPETPSPKGENCKKRKHIKCIQSQPLQKRRCILSSFEVKPFNSPRKKSPIGVSEASDGTGTHRVTSSATSLKSLCCSSKSSNQGNTMQAVKECNPHLYKRCTSRGKNRFPGHENYSEWDTSGYSSFQGGRMDSRRDTWHPQPSVHHETSRRQLENHRNGYGSKIHMKENQGIEFNSKITKDLNDPKFSGKADAIEACRNLAVSGSAYGDCDNRRSGKISKPPKPPPTRHGIGFHPSAKDFNSQNIDKNHSRAESSLQPHRGINAKTYPSTVNKVVDKSSNIQDSSTKLEALNNTCGMNSNCKSLLTGNLQCNFQETLSIRGQPDVSVLHQDEKPSHCRRVQKASTKSSRYHQNTNMCSMKSAAFSHANDNVKAAVEQQIQVMPSFENSQEQAGRQHEAIPLASGVTCNPPAEGKAQVPSHSAFREKTVPSHNIPQSFPSSSESEGIPPDPFHDCSASNSLGGSGHYESGSLHFHSRNCALPLKHAVSSNSFLDSVTGSKPVQHSLNSEQNIEPQSNCGEILQQPSFARITNSSKTLTLPNGCEQNSYHSASEGISLNSETSGRSYKPVARRCRGRNYEYRGCQYSGNNIRHVRNTGRDSKWKETSVQKQQPAVINCDQECKTTTTHTSPPFTERSTSALLNGLDPDIFDAESDVEQTDSINSRTPSSEVSSLGLGPRQSQISNKSPRNSSSRHFVGKESISCVNGGSVGFGHSESMCRGSSRTNSRSSHRRTSPRHSGANWAHCAESDRVIQQHGSGSRELDHSSDDAEDTFTVGIVRNHSRTNHRRRGSQTRSQRPPLIRGASSDHTRTPPGNNDTRQQEEDEQLARMLQEQYDAEIEASTSDSLNVIDSDDDERAALRTIFMMTARLFADPSSSSDSSQSDQRIPARYMLRNTSRNQRPASRGHHFHAGGQRQPVTFHSQRGRALRSQSQTLVFSPLENDMEMELMLPEWSDLDYETNDYELLVELAESLGDVVPRGLRKCEINRLPTRVFPSSESKQETGGGSEAASKECHVCLSNYKPGERLKRLTCCHEFHSACIDRWLKNSGTCPICRAEVNVSQ